MSSEIYRRLAFFTKYASRTSLICLLLAHFLSGCMLVPIAAQYPVTSASVGVLATTGKGPADHAVSYAQDEDCNTLRLLSGEPICQPYTVAPVVEKSQKDTNGH
jgi:hypothetical protein